MGEAREDGGAGRARSRRMVLAAAAGGLGMIVGETVGRASPAQAANGGPVLQGTDNGPAASRTMVFTASNTEFASLADPNSSGKGSLGVYGHGQAAGMLGEAAGTSGTGVIGTAGAGGDGVHGTGNGIGSGVVGHGGGTGGRGVYGLGGPGNGLGVEGDGNGTGSGVVGKGGLGGGRGGDFYGAGSATGVLGVGGSGNASGVEGDGGGTGSGVVGWGGSSNGSGVVGHGGTPEGAGVQGNGQGTGDGVIGVASTGNGVHGQATMPGGVGVLAESTAGGTALQATGPAVFSRSGVLTVTAGKSAVTHTGVALTSSSLILATLQQNRAGVFVQAAVPNVSGSSFTIYLSKAVSASTKVAWFVVN